MVQSSAPLAKPTAEVPAPRLPEWLETVKAKARGIHHGEIHIRFVDGKPRQIIVSESELLR